MTFSNVYSHIFLVLGQVCKVSFYVHTRNYVHCSDTRDLIIYTQEMPEYRKIEELLLCCRNHCYVFLGCFPYTALLELRAKGNHCECLPAEIHFNHFSTIGWSVAVLLAQLWLEKLIEMF